jgi:hypothetical protein
MATQSNNLVLLERDPTSPIRGMQRVLSSSDALAFDLNGFDITAQSASMVSGGSTLDVQAPYVNIGTASAGGEQNVEVDIGHAGSIVKLDGQAVYSDAPTYFRASEVGIELEAAVELYAGDIVTVDSAADPADANIPRVKKSEADAANVVERAFSGVVTSAYVASGANGYMATVPGTVVSISFKSDDLPSASSIGAPVYVSTTLGKVQMTPPSVSNQTVYQVGFLVSSTATVGNRYAVLLQPQLIGRIP